MLISCVVGEKPLDDKIAYHPHARTLKICMHYVGSDCNIIHKSHVKGNQIELTMCSVVPQYERGRAARGLLRKLLEEKRIEEERIREEQRRREEEQRR